MRPEDVVPAISWLEAHVNEIESGGFEELSDAIIRLLSKVDIDADMRASLARIAVSRAASYEGILFNRRLDRRNNESLDTDSRRRIANAIIDETTDDTVILYVSDRPAGGSGLLRPDDLEWIVAEAATATGPRLAALDRLFGLSFVPDRRDHVNLFLDLDEQHPIRTGRPTWVQVELESDTAAEMKRMHQLMNPGYVHKSHQPEANVKGRLRELLARAKSGEPQVFVELGRVLATTELEFDLTATPTRRTLDLEVKDMIASAAEAYLRTKSCASDAWVDDPSTLHFSAYAGYRALTLLLRVRPAALDLLSSADWVEWAPMIATMTRTVDGPTWDDKAEFLRRADVHAHHELVDALTRYISAAAKTDRQLFWADELQFLFDDDIQNFILRLVDASTGPLTMDLLRVLCRKRPETAIPLLQSILTVQRHEQRSARIAAGILLVDHDLGGSWHLLRSDFDADLQLALEVLGNADAVRYQQGDTLLPEVILAEVYIWLMQNFYPSADPQQTGVHVVGPREQIARWRDRLLIELRDKGTAAAIDALTSVAKALPTVTSLKRAQAAAMTAFSRKAWEGVNPRDLVELARNEKTMLVNTDRDLQVVVKNALAIVQRELTGANPQSHLLWDTHSHRPKSEDEISDHLRNRLAELTGGNNLVVNREVQVRRNQPSGLPERADIQVDAATGRAGPFPTISLPVEVKGAWNGELLTAMRSQLADRYMTDLDASYGSYIVLWPDIEYWTDKDTRRRIVTRLDRDEVVEQLANQTRQLRDEGYFVEVVHLGIEYKRPGRKWRDRLASGPLRFVVPQR